MIFFLSSVLCNLIDKNVIQKKLHEKKFKTIFSSEKQIFQLLSSILCILLIYYTQPLKKFFVKMFIFEKKTRQNFIFLLFRRSSVISSIRMSFEKDYMKKKLMTIFSSEKQFFQLLSSILCIPLIYYTQPLKFFFVKMFIYEKKLAKTSFFFIGPLYPHWEHCHSEKLSRKKLSLKYILYEKYNFYHPPCVPPLISFAKSFNIRFSWKCFSMTKKITWKKFSKFHHRSYLTPLIKNSFKNVVWLEKYIFLRDTVFLNCIFCF